MSGAGLTGDPVVGTDRRVDAVRDAQGGQGPFGRVAIVGRRHGDPAAAGAQSVEQDTQVGHGSGGRDRVGRVPGRLERPFRLGRAQAARHQHLARAVAQACHRRRGQPSAGSTTPVTGSTPSIA